MVLLKKVKWKPLSHVWLFATPWTVVHGILQARILECVAFPFSRGSSQPRDWTQVSHIAGRFFTSWATRAAHYWSAFQISREGEEGRRKILSNSQGIQVVCKHSGDFPHYPSSKDLRTWSSKEAPVWGWNLLCYSLYLKWYPWILPTSWPRWLSMSRISICAQNFLCPLSKAQMGLLS